ncbi:MAG: serine hydrolase [Pseudomonadota bacterium]
MAIPQSDPARCGLSWATKVVASGVFITGRDPREIFNFSCNWMAASDSLMSEVLESRDPAAILELPVEISVDQAAERVTLRLNGVEAHAGRFGSQGCMVLDSPSMAPRFTPSTVTPKPVVDQFEPVEVRLPDQAGTTGVAADAVHAAIDCAFANPMHFTNAFVVVHKGQLIAERYREPYDAQTQFESWSMGKSIAATMVGIAQRQGRLHIDEADLFEEWRGEGDPRQDIRLRDILNMASGLKFSGSYGRDEDHSVKQENGEFLDHIYVYGGGTDSREFCLSKSAEDPPGTAGRYRNCDPLLATALVRDRVVDGDVHRFLGWPQAALYDRIGSAGMVLETDPFGSFLIYGHDYVRARDWARLGQLYLNRGAWGREQLLDEDFVEFVQTPAAVPWAHNPYYGGFFCTNATGLLPGVPQDAFWMSGGGRQRTLIIPSRDLVIVRMGHMAGMVFGAEQSLNQATSALCAAVDEAV